MSDRLFDYFGELLRSCLDTDLSTAPQIGTGDFARFLTDDVRLHVLQSRLAAAVTCQRAWILAARGFAALVRVRARILATLPLDRSAGGLP